MVHLTLKHDNLTGLAPLDLPGRSTATGPAGVFDNPASRQVLTRRANQRATLDSGVLNGLTALRQLLTYQGNPCKEWLPLARMLAR